jgi:hypothetical protein
MHLAKIFDFIFIPDLAIDSTTLLAQVVVVYSLSLVLTKVFEFEV